MNLTLAERREVRAYFEEMKDVNDEKFTKTVTDEYYSHAELADKLDMTSGELSARIHFSTNGTSYLSRKKADSNLKRKKYNLVSAETGAVCGTITKHEWCYKLNDISK